MTMRTERRWRAAGGIHETKGDGEGAVRDYIAAAEEYLPPEQIEKLRGQLDIEPVTVLVDAYNVVSRRDGELIVREVDEATAEAEARRLAGEQADDKIANPIHPLIPVDDERTAYVPHEATPHPGYEVVPAPERVVEPDEQEA